MRRRRDPAEEFVDRERVRAREMAAGAFQEAIAGMGTGVVPSPVTVSIDRDSEPPRPAGAVTMGNPPERHPRPLFRTSQLEGAPEEERR